MLRYILVDLVRLEETFFGMSNKSQRQNWELYTKLRDSGKATPRKTDIIGQEFLMWLGKKGIVEVRIWE